MNLFRSEEHVRNWSGFKSDTEEGIVTLADIAKVFSAAYFQRRSDPDYFSKRPEYRGSFAAAIEELGKTRPFWLPKAP
jgi:hypothetical protein